MVEDVGAVEVGEVEIDVAILVVVGGDDALGEGFFIDAGCVRDVFEGPVPRLRNNWLGAFSLPINRSR